MPPKSEQLQIRVSRAQKTALRRLARAAGLDVSAYVLARALPEPQVRLAEVVRALAAGSDQRYALAELNDLLTALTPGELAAALVAPPPELLALPPFLENYVAALAEQACGAAGIPVPPWIAAIPGLAEPWFAAPLRSLRLYLLAASPVAFKRRNLFVDAALGARV